VLPFLNEEGKMGVLVCRSVPMGRNNKNEKLKRELFAKEFRP